MTMMVIMVAIMMMMMMMMMMVSSLNHHHHHHHRRHHHHNSYHISNQHKHQHHHHHHHHHRLSQRRDDISSDDDIDIDGKMTAAIASFTDRRLTASDLATHVGIDISLARQGLMSRAYASEADMDVTNDGDIIYSFPKDFKRRMVLSSSKYKLLAVRDKVLPLLSQVFVTSFGLVFLSTTMLVFSTLLLLATQSSNNNNENKSSSRRISYSSSSEIPTRLIINSVSDFLNYGARQDMFDENYQLKKRRRLSFIESFASFFFGDGDNNKYLEQLQLNQLASLIRYSPHHYYHYYHYYHYNCY